MKILFTVSTYYPKDDGVSRVTQYLAEGLAKKGHDVIVVTSSFGGDDKEKHNGVTIKRVNLYTKYGLYFGDKKGYKRLIDHEANLADVMINVCTQNAFTDVILRRLKKYRCKKILYMHGMFDFGFHKINFSSISSIINKTWKEMRWFYYYLVNAARFRRYDSVIQLHEKDYANKFFKQKFGIESYIIGNAVDNMFFCSPNVANFVKPFDKYIIYVANYDDRKDQKFAVLSFLKSNIDCQIGLVLIGSKNNSYYNSLQKYIIKKKKKMGISSDKKPILLLYNMDRRLIPCYVSSSYCYYMTSKWEAFPISIAESMACGVPFISTNVGVVRFFLGGIVSDKKDFCYWTESFLNNTTIRNSFSDIASNYAKINMRIEQKVEQMEELLKKVCKKGK